jgi:amidophosphoribosyltransferase
VFASETRALDMIGARFVRDVEHGEMVVVSEGCIQSLRPFPAAQARPCVFEYVYFAMPDSVVNGRSVYAVRKRMGQRLAQESPADVDVIVPVPDSGGPAALGYAQESGVPYEMGIIRNHYIGRTFIQPSQGMREQSVRMKLSPNKSVLAGKRVMLIDDSIVRGTNSVRVVRMVREAGAREVHLRSASPQIKWPDFYGIDMPDRADLLAANRTLPEMADLLEVDSLGFLSVDGLYWAMGAGPRDPKRPQFTDHYFTGDYPTRLLDRENAARRDASLEPQLSFLEDA